ncbi:dihydrofolate reductase family protein [Danxiaibacter flavus]|uniref:Dihydrofolate reductase family protein n=1 Tax=Danxiaibacter flavus TaxID=3049108 RepID=A0ABV3ZL41_9BACT|nr:dihydrofolate reductase family protein [Chitinophagaceae bacterium DXS]
MGKIVLYIAQSLDGFIADENGKFDFLNDFMRPEEDYGYAEFLKTLGAVIMATTTYKDILKLGFWYDGLENHIFSNQLLTVPEGKTIQQHSGDPSALVAELRQKEKDTWLVGGASLVTQFLNKGLLDELMVAIIPRTLGRGIPLFKDVDVRYAPELKGSKVFSDGVVMLHYVFANK